MDLDEAVCRCVAIYSGLRRGRANKCACFERPRPCRGERRQAWRRPKLIDHQRREAIPRRDHGEEALAEIGRYYNVSGWMISRLTSGSNANGDLSYGIQMAKFKESLSSLGYFWPQEKPANRWPGRVFIDEFPCARLHCMDGRPGDGTQPVGRLTIHGVTESNEYISIIVTSSRRWLRRKVPLSCSIEANAARAILRARGSASQPAIIRRNNSRSRQI